MNERLEAAKKEHVFVADLLNQTDEAIVENLRLGAESKDSKKIQSAIVDLISDWMICSIESWEIQKKYDRYKKALKYDSIDKSQGYIEYCYIIQKVIFECAYIAFPLGKTYEEFVHGILARERIEIDQKQEKKLIKNFKIDLLDINSTRAAYAAKVNLYRNTHLAVEDKNKNRKDSKEKREEIPTYYYPSILEFDEPAREFEFYIKKNNAMAKNNFDNYDQLKQLAVAKLSPVIEGEPEEAIKRFQKIRKIPIKDMSEEQLADFREYIETKLRFIDQYAPELYQEMGRWSLYKDYYIDRLLYAEEAPDFVSFYFPALGEALSDCVRSVSKNLQEENKKYLWEKIIALANRANQRKKQTESAINYYISFGISIDLKVFKKLWEDVPVYDKDRILADLSDNWIERLEQSDYGLQDFIELLLTCGLSEEYRQEQVVVLTEGFRRIFQFLSDCKEKETKQKIQYEGRNEKSKTDYRINISDEIKGLYRYFKDKGIDLPENCECCFNAKRYFADRYKTRYMNFFYQFEKLIRKDSKKIDEKDLIKEYVRSILFKQNGTWQIISFKLIRNVNEELLTWIFKCLFPNQIPTEGIELIYERKERVLEILSKYGCTEGLGLN